METIPTVHSEVTSNNEILLQLEDNGQQVSEHCLGLPEVLRRVLEQLSNKELIDLSLVNKLWNFEARSVLRDRGCLRAKIYSQPACSSLVDLASDLEQMYVVPFTGIHVEIGHFGDERNTCQAFPIGILDHAHQVILDRLRWKHLSVAFCGNGRECEDCPALVLVRRILEDYCGVLEELSIFISHCQFDQVFQSIFQYRSLPSLKTLKLSSAFVKFPTSNASLKAMVSRAPNLEKLYMDGAIQFQENVMDGSSAVLVASSGFCPLYEQVCDSLIAVLRTEKIQVYTSQRQVLDVELLNKFVPGVLQASYTTLKTLWMDLIFAVPLMCYGICLENVTELCILITDSTMRDIQPHILNLVKSLDFTRLFPKLDRVKISDWQHRDISSDEISAFVERGNVVATEALPDRAINIKHLELNGSLGNLTAGLLAEMFPYVTRISVRGESPEFPFTLLWNHFRCLAELHVVSCPK